MLLYTDVRRIVNLIIPRSELSTFYIMLNKLFTQLKFYVTIGAYIKIYMF